MASLIAIPTSTPINDTSFKITLNSHSQDLKPLYAGIAQRINRGGDVWSIEASTRPMDKPDAQALQSILNQGTIAQLKFTLPFQTNLPDATAVSGSGTTLNINGLTSGQVIKGGSYLTIEYSLSGTLMYYLHQITSDVSVASDGSAALSVMPAIRRTGNLGGSNVVLSAPYIAGFGTQLQQAMSSSNFRLDTYTINFGVTEVE